MLDTRQAHDALSRSDARLRCEALIDRVSATAIGENPQALRVMLAECDALERAAPSASAVYKVRNARHWLKLAFGHELHAYPDADLRRAMLSSLAAACSAM